MRLLEALRTYLRALSARPTTRAELAKDRRRIIEMIDGAGGSARWARKESAAWTDRTDVAMPVLRASLAHGLLHGSSDRELEAAVELALRRSMGVESDAGSPARAQEAGRLLQEAIACADVLRERPGQSLSEYASRIRATALSNDTVQPTPLGRLFLDLPDRDATRWNLAVEVVQSTGPEDPWRLDTSSAVDLLRQRRWELAWNTDCAWPASWETLHRLSRMGALRAEDEGEARTVVDVTEQGHAWLAEVGSATETPFEVLARALLDDETTAAVERLRGARSRIAEETAAAAIRRQARMVAHEIRNGLVPVQDTFEAFAADAADAGLSALVDRHAPRIRSGLTRVFRFVADMLHAQAPAGVPPAPFDVGAAIREAIQEYEALYGHSPSFRAEGGSPRLVGHRDRFQIAILNLLRNAKQARPDGLVLRVEMTETVEPVQLVVVVEDNGPGVPAEHRAHIFEPDFSLRPDGAGLGLAFVREVVEGELSGELCYEESELGGARFVLRIPRRQEQAP